MAAGEFFSHPCLFQIFQVAIPIYFIYSRQVASSSASMRKCRVAPAIFEKSQGKIWSYQKCDEKNQYTSNGSSATRNLHTLHNNGFHGYPVITIFCVNTILLDKSMDNSACISANRGGLKDNPI
jgi:hypothetical protein